MLKQAWWKYLCVGLMLYALSFGLLNPLKHGIKDVSPDRIEAGTKAILTLSAYNAHYLNQSDPITAYLKYNPPSDSKDKNQYLLKALSVKAITDNQIELEFHIPEYLPDSRSLALFSVIVNSPIDGAAAIPSKVIIHQHKPDLVEGIRLWSVDQHPDFHQAKRSLFPYRNILVETIRNTFYHVSLWFAMFLMFGMSVYFSYRVLKFKDLDADLRSYALVRTGFFFGLLGCLTGSLWAKYTWETWWTTDIKLNMAALTMLIYLAYMVLRASIDDLDRKARISSAYNIFALVAVIPLIFVLPRLTDSLHPGNGGNPAFGSEDMDNSLRMVFYPAVLGFMLLGLWIASLVYRIDAITAKLDEADLD